jgi:hypothetical protein
VPDAAGLNQKLPGVIAIAASRSMIVGHFETCDGDNAALRKLHRPSW